MSNRILKELHKSLVRFMALVMILSVALPAEMSEVLNTESLIEVLSTSTEVYAAEQVGSSGTASLTGGSWGSAGVHYPGGIRMSMVLGGSYLVSKSQTLQEAIDLTSRWIPEAMYSGYMVDPTVDRNRLKGVANYYDGGTVRYTIVDTSGISYASSSYLTNSSSTNQYSVSKVGNYWIGGGVYFSEILNSLNTDPAAFKSSGWRELFGTKEAQSEANMSFICTAYKSGSDRIAAISGRLDKAFANDLLDDNDPEHLGYDQLVGNADLPQWVQDYAESVGISAEDAAININMARFLDAMFQVSDISFTSYKSGYYAGQIQKILNNNVGDDNKDYATAIAFYPCIIVTRVTQDGMNLLMATDDYIEAETYLSNSTGTLVSNYNIFMKYNTKGLDLAGDFYQILKFAYNLDKSLYPSRTRITNSYNKSNALSFGSSAVTYRRLSTSGGTIRLADGSTSMSLHEIMALTDVGEDYKGYYNMYGSNWKYLNNDGPMYGFNMLYYIVPNLIPDNPFGKLEALPDDYPMESSKLGKDATVEIRAGVTDIDKKNQWIDFLSANPDMQFTFTIKSITRTSNYGDFDSLEPVFEPDHSGSCNDLWHAVYTGSQLKDLIENNSIIVEFTDTETSDYKIDSSSLATGEELRVEFTYTMDCVLEWDEEQSDGSTKHMESYPAREEDKTDDASYIYTKHPPYIYRTYTSTPEAYAELKNYGSGSDWSSGTLNEDWEVMTGVPTTEQLYYAAGGSEFIVDITLAYTEETAVRSYVSHYEGTKCEFYAHDALKDGSIIYVPNGSGNVSCTGKVVTTGDSSGWNPEAIDRGQGSGGSQSWIDGNIGCNHEFGGDWTITYQITGDSHCEAESGGETWHSCPHCGARVEDDHAELETLDYENACNTIANLASFITGQQVIWTSTSEGSPHGEFNIEQGVTREVNWSVSTSSSYDSGDHTSAGNDGAAGCGGAHDKCGSCCGGHTGGSGSNTYTYTDGCGNACYGTPCRAGSKCSGSHKWTVTLVATIPAHAVCGPCCSHNLPELYDSWSQTFTYDTFQIIDAHLWEIDQAAASGLEEVIGPAVDIDGTDKGTTTITNDILGTYDTTQRKGSDILGAYNNPHGVNDGIVGAKITTNHPTVFYNIAFKNSQDLPDNSQDAYYNTQDSIWGGATETSLVGRVRYNLNGNWTDASQHDEVYYELGTRTAHCDGLAKTYTTNVTQAGGGGHSETWADGFIYDSYAGTARTLGSTDVGSAEDFNTGNINSDMAGTAYGGQLDFPRNDIKHLQENCDGYDAEYTSFLASIGITVTTSDPLDNVDVNTDEYKGFLEKRDQPMQVTLINDFLILQTTSGDQSVMYFDKESETEILFDGGTNSFYDKTVRLIEDVEQTTVDTDSPDYEEPEVTIEENPNIPTGSSTLITVPVTAETMIPSMWILPEDMWEDNNDSAADWDDNEINVGGYNGKATTPTKKFDVTSTGKTTTFFDKGDRAKGNGQVRRNGVLQNFSGQWNERVEGESEPHSYIVRDKRPTEDLMLNSLPLNIIATIGNDEYLTGIGYDIDSEVFWSNNIHWSDIGSSIQARAKSYVDNPSFKSNGMKNLEYTETTGDTENFDFSWLKDVVTVWGQSNYNEENSYQGYVLDTLYLDGGSADVELNGLVIHNPISSDYASLISLPDERDQRYARAIDPSYLENQNDNSTCPRTVEECEFAVVDCKYGTDQRIANFTLDSEPDTKSMTNLVTNVTIDLPSGWSISSKALSASSSSTARISIPFAAGVDNTGLGISYSSTTQLQVSASVTLSDLSSSVDSRISQMLFSYAGVGLYVSNTGHIGIITKEGQYRESTSVTLSAGTTYNVSAVLSMYSLDDCSIKVNGNTVALTASNESDLVLSTDHIGKYLNIGGWTYNNKFGFRGTMDDIVVTRLAGTYEHTEKCYTTIEVHPNGLNVHIHDDSCLDHALTDENSQTWTYGYTGGVQTFTAPYDGTYKLEAWGASGGDARYVNSDTLVQDSGGAGGYASGEVDLTAGQTIYLYVGGEGGDQTSTSYPLSNFSYSSTYGDLYTDGLGGYNGGGNGGVDLNLDDYNGVYSESGAGGGGMTHISYVGTDTLGNKTVGSYVINQDYSFDANSVILAAGGGGGAASHFGDGYIVATPYNSAGIPSITNGSISNGNWVINKSGVLQFSTGTVAPGTSTNSLQDSSNGMIWKITLNGTNLNLISLSMTAYNGSSWGTVANSYEIVSTTTNSANTQKTFEVKVKTSYPCVAFCLNHSTSTTSSTVSSVAFESRFADQVYDVSAGGVGGGSSGGYNDYTKGGTQNTGYMQGLGSNGYTPGYTKADASEITNFTSSSMTKTSTVTTLPSVSVAQGIYCIEFTGTGLTGSSVTITSNSTNLANYIHSTEVSSNKVTVYVRTPASASGSTGLIAKLTHSSSASVTGASVYRIDGIDGTLIGTYSIGRGLADNGSIVYGPYVTVEPGEYVAGFNGTNLSSATFDADDKLATHMFVTEAVKDSKYAEVHIIVSEETVASAGGLEVRCHKGSGTTVEKMALYKIESDDVNSGATGGSGGGWYGGNVSNDIGDKTTAVAYGGAGGSGYIGGVENGTMIKGNGLMPDYTSSDSTATMYGNRGNGYIRITHANTFYDNLKALYADTLNDANTEAELREIFGDAFDSLFINTEYNVDSGDFIVNGSVIQDDNGGRITSAYNCNLVASGGDIIQYITGTAPYFDYDIADIEAADVLKIVVTLKNNTTASGAKLYWTTDQATGWSNTRSITGEMLSSAEAGGTGVSQVVTFYVDAVSGWQDTITKLRFAFPSADDKNYGEQIVIENISITCAQKEPGDILYDYTGSVQSFTPTVSGIYFVEAWGAEGGGSTSSTSSNGGKGGYTSAIVQLNAGTTYGVYVGGQGSLASSGLGSGGGWNGGGHGSAHSNGSTGYGGGGMSHFGTSLTDSFTTSVGYVATTIEIPSTFGAQTIEYSGSMTSVTLPAGTYKLEAYGAQGGGTGGYGGYSAGTVSFDTETTIYIGVGGQNSTFNGGGSGYDYNGGGATHIATKSGQLSTLSGSTSSILIVAGGGGAGRTGATTYGLGGGANMSGTAGHSGCGGVGGAGTTSSGGAAGSTGYSCSTAGSFGQGGSCSCTNTKHGNTECGGGGGYYGGGGGGHDCGGYNDNDDCGGGGGSGYANTSLLTDISGTTGANAGNGYVVITGLSSYKTITEPTTLSGSITSGATYDFDYTGSVESIDLPAGEYKLEVWGASGGDGQDNSDQGSGGYSTGILTLNSATTLYVAVGGRGTYRGSGGFNGGGSADYSSNNTGSGGGGTDIRVGSNSLYARVIVAGGGGGSGDDSSSTAGDGGGTSGIGNSKAVAGTQTSGYAFGSGEDGTSGDYAGGGGGWYGGCSNTTSEYPAAGGSGYVYTSATASSYPSGCLLNSTYYLSNASTSAGNTSFTSTSGGTETGHTGNGYARITAVSTSQTYYPDLGVVTNSTFNTSSVLLVAGGGGGADNDIGTAGGSDDGSGGVGGGLIGGDGLINGVTSSSSGAQAPGTIVSGSFSAATPYCWQQANTGCTYEGDYAYSDSSTSFTYHCSGWVRVSQYDYAAHDSKQTGGTQTTGYMHGQGESASVETDTGGAGGGWYGGLATNNSNGGAGGGSGYVSGSAQNTYTDSYGTVYTSQTIAGDQTIPTNPRNIEAGAGETSTGNSGNGFIRIHFLEFSGYDFPTYEELVDALDQLPFDSPLFTCDKKPNTHVCDSECGYETVLNCTEPHHAGNHYDGSPTCYAPCCNDANHKGHDATYIDGSFTPGNFINLDWGYEIFFPNTGDFYQSDIYGISKISTSRGMGFEDSMWTDIWTKKKTATFNFNAIYAGNLYLAGEEIPLADKGDYTGVDGSPYNEQNWTNFGTWLYNALYGAGVYSGNEVPLVEPGDHMTRVSGSTYIYPFYCVLANDEIGAGECDVRAYAINNAYDSYSKEELEEWDDSGSKEVFTNNVTNRNRNSSFESNHTTYNEFYFNIVGRIGSLALVDTGDYKFSNFFKQSTANTNTNLPSTTLTTSKQNLLPGTHATNNGSAIVASVVGSYAYGTPNIGSTDGVAGGYYKITITGSGLLNSNLQVLVSSSWDTIYTLSKPNTITVTENSIAMVDEESNSELFEDSAGTGEVIVGHMETEPVVLEAGEYKIVSSGQGFLNVGPNQPDWVPGTGAEFTKDGKFIVTYYDSNGVYHEVSYDHNYSSDSTNTTEFTLDEDAYDVVVECYYQTDVFMIDSVTIYNLNTETSKDLVKTGDVTKISQADTFAEYYMNIADDTEVEIRVVSKGRTLTVESIKVESLGNYSDSWIVDGIVHTVDSSQQREYLTGTFDVRGLTLKDTGTSPEDDGRGAMIAFTNAGSLYTDSELSFSNSFTGNAYYAETIDTYNSLPWARTANCRINLPLSPNMNNIDILKDEPLTMGYGLYLSVQTIGNYNSRDADFLQVIPEYYLLNTTTGEFFPADIYLEYNSGYYPVNIWGLMTDEDEYTWGAGGSGYDVNSIYNYSINLDWVEENARRMITLAEEYKTGQVASQLLFTALDGTPLPYRTPSGHTYIQGNAQFLQLDGRARTFIGGEFVNTGKDDSSVFSRYDSGGKSKYGELINYGPGDSDIFGAGAANRVIKESTANEIAYNEVGRISGIEWWYRAQRWHFTICLPSSSVAVRAGETASTDTIHKYWSEDSEYLLVATIDIRALGDVWNLRYGQEGGEYNVENHDIVLKDKGSYTIPTTVNVNGHEHIVPFAIAIYGPNPIEFEYSVISLY